MGSEEELKEVKIGALLHPDVKSRLIDLLKEYVDIFTWSYQDMPGLNIKQKLRWTHPDMEIKIKEEVFKQIDDDILVTYVYPQWVTNIVHVPKKDGKVRM